MKVPQFVLSHLWQIQLTLGLFKRLKSAVQSSMQVLWYQTLQSSHATAGSFQATFFSHNPQGKMLFGCGPGFAWMSPASISKSNKTALTCLCRRPTFRAFLTFLLARGAGVRNIAFVGSHYKMSAQNTNSNNTPAVNTAIISGTSLLHTVRCSDLVGLGVSPKLQQCNGLRF